MTDDKKYEADLAGARRLAWLEEKLASTRIELNICRVDLRRSKDEVANLRARLEDRK